MTSVLISDEVRKDAIVTLASWLSIVRPLALMAASLSPDQCDALADDLERIMIGLNVRQVAA